MAAQQTKPVDASALDAKAQQLTTAEKILTNAQSGRTVIQEFCPLAESLEWQLGQEYLRDRGNKAFISDASPVPFIINNDGTLSYHAAEVFFTSLVEAEKAGELAPEENIHVLELGIGVGLFARYFLDAFRDLCVRNDKDFYNRFCYIAADRSQRMLDDLLRYGVLKKHPGRYRVRLVDAMKPEQQLPYDVCFAGHTGRPLRAVFLNYVLDCLPAAVLDFSDEQAVKQLHVQTCIARNVTLEDHTDLKPEQLRERAISGNPIAQQELLGVYGLFASEYDYRPVDLDKLPYGAFARDLSNGKTKHFLHSYGAIHSLEKLIELVHPRGFILINDYGSTSIGMEADFEHQRFSLATAVGLNFAELKSYFEQTGRYNWITPLGGAAGIYSRLLAHNPDHVTHGKFIALFGNREHQRLQEPIDKARQWLQVGRFELAASDYREALVRQPYNWVLLNEIAMFLIYQLRDVKKGIDLAKVALQQNPTCSAELWNTLGDGLFDWGRLPEARSAYLKALTVNEFDVRARFNLAWVHIREKDYAAALKVIAEGLALDKTGEYRDRLLQKLQEALALLQLRNQQEYLHLINLVSKTSATAPETPKPDVEKRGEGNTQRPG